MKLKTGIDELGIATVLHRWACQISTLVLFVASLVCIAASICSASEAALTASRIFITAIGVAFFAIVSGMLLFGCANPFRHHLKNPGDPFLCREFKGRKIGVVHAAIRKAYDISAMAAFMWIVTFDLASYVIAMCLKACSMSQMAMAVAAYIMAFAAAIIDFGLKLDE